MRSALSLGKQAEVAVDEGGRLLEDAESADHRPRHHVGADVEVNQRAGRLGAVIAVVGHFDLAHRVGFSSHKVSLKRFTAENAENAEKYQFNNTSFVFLCVLCVLCGETLFN